jgi:CBS domain-containing protein
MQVSVLLQTKGTEVVTVGPETRVGGARPARRPRIGAVVVTPDDRSVAGIVSERDLVRASPSAARPHSRPVPPSSCPPSSPPASPTPPSSG